MSQFRHVGKPAWMFSWRGQQLPILWWLWPMWGWFMANGEADIELPQYWVVTGETSHFAETWEPHWEEIQLPDPLIHLDPWLVLVGGSTLPLWWKNKCSKPPTRWDVESWENPRFVRNLRYSTGSSKSAVQPRTQGRWCFSSTLHRRESLSRSLQQSYYPLVIKHDNGKSPINGP